MLLCAEIFIEDFIKKENLTYEATEINDGKTVLVKAPWNGTDTFFFFHDYNGKSVHIVSVIEKNVSDEKLETLYAVCNSLNEKYFMLKFYVDSDNNVVAVDDAILDEDSVVEECRNLLIIRFDILKEVKPIIMRAIWA